MLFGPAMSLRVPSLLFLRMESRTQYLNSARSTAPWSVNSAFESSVRPKLHHLSHE